MTDCLEEQQTQHYRGKWYGFGPVNNGERVVFAVFERTKRAESQLTANSFESSYLANSSQSLTRASYVTRTLFDREIAVRGSATKGPLIGIACADVSKVRKLRA